MVAVYIERLMEMFALLWRDRLKWNGAYFVFHSGIIEVTVPPDPHIFGCEGKRRHVSPDLGVIIAEHAAFIVRTNHETQSRGRELPLLRVNADAVGLGTNYKSFVEIDCQMRMAICKGFDIMGDLAKPLHKFDADRVIIIHPKLKAVLSVFVANFVDCLGHDLAVSTGAIRGDNGLRDVFGQIKQTFQIGVGEVCPRNNQQREIGVGLGADAWQS